jgi:preprotein translocase subunit SecF
MTAPTATTPKRGFGGTLRDIYHERTRFDFVGKSRIWLLISGSAVVASLIALVLSGLNLGLEFDGGTQWQFQAKARSVKVGDVRDVVADAGESESKILLVGENGVRVQTAELKDKQRAKITSALAEYAGVERSAVSVTNVGPSWGDRISRKALIALIVFFILIASYLSFRFEWKMAISAIAAVVHDIIITVGVYAITGFEVTPATVIAFLTILGFSLYDTVVVFDKINENTPSVGSERADTYSRMVNRSMNAVLMRSINTSFVALLPVASLLVVGSAILGAVTIKDFALALFVGLLVGAYSSIFVATPLLAWIKEREPRYRAIRARSASQQARDLTSPAPAGTVEEPEGDVAPVAPRPSTGAIAPRPRQQRRKRRRR